VKTRVAERSPGQTHSTNPKDRRKMGTHGARRTGDKAKEDSRRRGNDVKRGKAANKLRALEKRKRGGVEYRFKETTWLLA